MHHEIEQAVHFGRKRHGLGLLGTMGCCGIGHDTVSFLQKAYNDSGKLFSARDMRADGPACNRGKTVL